MWLMNLLRLRKLSLYTEQLSSISHKCNWVAPNFPGGHAPKPFGTMVHVVKEKKHTLQKFLI